MVIAARESEGGLLVAQGKGKLTKDMDADVKRHKQP